MGRMRLPSSDRYCFAVGSKSSSHHRPENFVLPAWIFVFIDLVAQGRTLYISLDLVVVHLEPWQCVFELFALAHKYSCCACCTWCRCILTVLRYLAGFCSSCNETLPLRSEFTEAASVRCHFFKFGASLYLLLH